MVVCPMCHNAGPHRLLRARDIAFGTNGKYLYAKCTTCSHTWLITRRSSSDVFGESAEGFVSFVMEHPLVGWVIYQPRLRWLAKYISFNNSTSVLDVGCGTGQFLGYVQRTYDCRCFGVDLDPALAKTNTERSITLVTADFEKLETNQRFDVITMFQVIEHFGNPTEAARKAYDLLKPGGYLCIETPATDSMAFSIFQKYWFPLLPPYHRHIFSRRSLRRLLQDYVPGGEVIAFSSLYIPGEFSCSASLPFARFAPHPFRRRRESVLISGAALLCIAAAILLYLPGEILVAATEQWTNIASHQRVLYRKEG